MRARAIATLLLSLTVLIGAGSATAQAATPAQHEPVVLVTGLDDSHPGLTPGGNCATVGSIATLCAAVQSMGYRRGHRRRRG